MTVAAMQAAARLLLKSNEGYNQSARTSFFDHKTGKIIPGKAGDCSTTCGWIAYQGGYLKIGRITGLLWTGNFDDVLVQEGGFDRIVFKSLSQVRAGDFLLTRGHHVVFALTAKVFVSWEYDERGKASGGKPGIQKGEKVSQRGAYIRPGGWQYILRPRANNTWRGRALKYYAQANAAQIKFALRILNARMSHDGPLWSAYFAQLDALNKGVKFSYVPGGWVSIRSHAFVVLGSALSKTGAITGKYLRRLKLALAAAQANPNSMVLVSGGAPQNGVTEAAAGAAWLVANGLDQSRIVQESKSASTIGNADYSVPILRKLGVHSITLVSDTSHLRRALSLFYAAILKIEQAENVDLAMSFTEPLAYNDYAPAPVKTEGPVAASDRAIITAEVAALLGLTSQYNATK